MRNTRLTPHWEIYSREIKSIIERLQRKLNINYFGYAYVTKDAKYIALASDPRAFTISHEIYKIPVSGLANFSDLSSGFVFPSSTDDCLLGWEDGMFDDIKATCNIINPAMFINKSDNIAELFFFSLDEPNAYEKYCRDLSLFENFMFFFRDASEDILKNCMKTINKYTKQETVNFSCIAELSDDLKLPIKTYRLLHGSDYVNFTKSEFMVLQNISHGKSAKTASIQLGCSNKNIEKHIANMKQKNGLLSTDQLINIYWNNHLNHTLTKY